MPVKPNAVFNSLADPTRRAIFERLVRDGELTVRALTDRAGVSQPAVSKHLRVLKLVGSCATGAKDARPTTARGLKVWPP
jgi:DNA-binding transcriptional ArsR family regulator